MTQRPLIFGRHLLALLLLKTSLVPDTCFCFFVLGPHLAVFRAYSDSAQGSLLVMFRGQYIVPGNECSLTTCKTGTLPIVLYHFSGTCNIFIQFTCLFWTHWSALYKSFIFSIQRLRKVSYRPYALLVFTNKNFKT